MPSLVSLSLFATVSPNSIFASLQSRLFNDSVNGDVKFGDILWRYDQSTGIMFVIVEQVKLTGVGGLGLRGDRNLFVLLSVHGSLWFSFRHGESVKSALARRIRSRGTLSGNLTISCV